MLFIINICCIFVIHLKVMQKVNKEAWITFRVTKEEKEALEKIVPNVTKVMRAFVQLLIRIK